MHARNALSALVDGSAVDGASRHSATAQRALHVAAHLQRRAHALRTPAERRQQAELDRMLRTPGDKATLVQMTDQAFRANDPARAVEHLQHVLDVHGVPRYLGAVDRLLMHAFRSFGGVVPGIALRLVKAHMRRAAAGVVLPGETAPLARRLGARRREGVRMNVNFLGEAILSEPEAERRLRQYLDALRRPEVEVVSIKISTLYSQISSVAREHTIATLCDRLERLYRTADESRFLRADGTSVPKFVYLDMEEYRDKDLTLAAFMRTLERPGLGHVRAGIALQSYLPDSYRSLLELQDWARGRAASGGGRVTVRLVKGANMESERVEASVRGWPQAPFRSKLGTDANYLRMLHAALEPANLAAMDVGVASHNLFDVGYALVLAHERGALDRVQFEMLEGMADAQRRTLTELGANVLLYAPACRKESFTSAIGYLIRRLDENTGEQNFLRHAFRMDVGGSRWRAQEQAFLAALEAADAVGDAPRRDQDRSAAAPHRHAIDRGWQQLENEPDTDFALPQNAAWARAIVERWWQRCGERAASIPLVIAGEELREGRELRECVDPSRPGVVVGRYREATDDDVVRAVEHAAADPDGWRARPVDERFAVLGRVAEQLRLARGELIGAALADGGKTLVESDPEVSEAVDFVEFYRASARWWQRLPTLQARPKGVVVVVPPWNFPIAIPCGGIAAALAAGNTVVLKPASNTVLVAWELCQCFWRAGVSRNVLQFVPCAGSRAGRRLVGHPRVDAVILTGGTSTALKMLEDAPQLCLYAETGGKDATIVTALADRDQAVKHVLQSAFGHSGQKCSATSLLLLQDEVYDDPAFRRALCEAVASLRVGSAWELDTRMGPLIAPPGGELATALTTLEPGEEWAVQPRPVEGNPALWTPGVKYGVSPGSFTHMTEFFGPVLAVMRFETLAEAVSLVNRTGYGLTSGLESLDEREWDYWRRHVRAGNLYVNRVTTGAIVLRQPFGGMGKSSIGPGLKAGGPNYVAQLMDFADADVAPSAERPVSPVLASVCRGLDAQGVDDAPRVAAAACSYEHAMREEFSREHDHFRLLGQDNVRRYLPAGRVCVRVHAADTAFDVIARACAAHAAGCRVVVSTPPDESGAIARLLEPLSSAGSAAFEFAVETDAELVAAIDAGCVDRVRYAAPGRVPREVLAAGNRMNGCIVRMPVSAEGRLELLWYLREQSISVDYHRYGNLGPRAGEERAAVQ